MRGSHQNCRLKCEAQIRPPCALPPNYVVDLELSIKTSHIFDGQKSAAPSLFNHDVCIRDDSFPCPKMDLASSVAGLIGLAGLAVQSASALYTFCRKIPRVAGEVEAIISEVRRLSQTLEAVKQVASDRTSHKFSSRTSRVIAELGEEIAQCTRDLDAWNTSMVALKMRDGKWARDAMKKLKLAADAGRFSESRLKISAHRDQLALLIELLTVYENSPPYRYPMA